jgi:GAF domain-containing protein
MGDAVRRGELVVADGGAGAVDGIDGEEGVDGASLAIPLTSSGIVIGAVGLHRPGGGDWSEDELTLIRSVGEQVSQALETRRLFEVERRRAQREQILRQTTDRVRAQTDLDAILRAAASEIRRAVGATHAVIRLETGTGPGSPGAAKPAEDTGD